MTSDTGSQQAPAYSPRYQRYAVLVLMLTYALSLLDRQVISVLNEPIKHELGLADWQLGTLTGVAFALLYTSLGIPMARWADRGDRVRIVIGSLTAWSLFTMLCGLATSFWTLALARMGVGFGEAGGTPAAQSLITATTPPAKRAAALAVYALSLPLAAFLGMGFGGVVAEAWGWRAALIAAGAPGLLLALLGAFTLREPRRGGSAGTQDEPPALSRREVVAEFQSKPAYWGLAVGTGVSGIVFYGQNAFLASLLMRTHGPEVAALGARVGVGPQAFTGLALGLVIGLSSGVGTVLGGRLGDRWARRHVSGYAKVPAIVLFFATPLFVAVGLAPTVPTVLGVLAIAVMAQGLVLGPVAAAIQSIVQPRARAMATAIQLILTNLIGAGLGPLGVGILSDVLSARYGPVLGLRWAVAASGLAYAFSWLSFFIAYRMIRGADRSAGMA